ncbi:serine carboxypeptidase S28-domain-containing protein [Lasiosphaeria ovina]|uniref:Serine carboxypeptidase S28-domain-containing protein n=1 Tax=Lasiosphaeria ovina TaxID=92902 RepID=A0AAE0N7I3_9PEZI|nr:serine carboxypeptidase S28-domain-containing protein [Lasiosphaeria ovina]
MPLDHFNASDRRTFINRFWVNDTYYKPGGPVILADFGEGTVMDDMVATILAEWGGHVATAPMELARELGGVAMVLEHRYYGYSQPFKLTSTTSYSTNDLPVGGPKDYQYLSVEQALEDVVYFASRHISQADLNLNTVLAAPNATWQLHPSRTPWIWASGSYGGSRGVWLRIRNPEVIYAVWASSAPVECRPDGSAYFNSIYRSMASNCSADVQAVVRHVDRVLSDDEDSRGAALDLKASNLARDVAANATRLSPVHVARLLIEPLSLLFQSFGPSATVHRFCDYMQRFDTAAAVELALAAYLHAVWRSKADVADVVGSDFRFLPLDRDAHAWAWQTWTETGMVPHVDAASPLALGSKFLGYAAARASFVNNTGGFPPAAPPDPRFVAALGGWHMRPSNVMFTHGEFDPWRAFSVSSLDQHLGAPRRRLVAGAAIPKCNRPPPGTDVFGLLHAGAAHSQDMVGLRGGGAGDEGRYFDHASQLFLKALREEWLPCFNATAV